MGLSVYIITFNNKGTLERALRSVMDLKDELIVVDSRSTDGTTEIAERYADRLYQLNTNDLREKYQFAQDMCQNEWVLFIDADEWIPKELKQEIRDALSKYNTFDGFVIRRRNFFLGREIRFGSWGSDKEIRLYRKEKGRWEGMLHAKVKVYGKVKKLKNFILHTPYHDLTEQINVINRYSSTYAMDLKKAGKNFSLPQLILRPFFRFFRDYIIKGGFLDGIPGLMIAVSTAYYVFMKQAKLYELQKLKADGKKAENSDCPQ